MARSKQGIELPFRVADEIAAEDDTAPPEADAEPEVPPRAPRHVLRAARLPGGKRPARLIGGPPALHGKVFPVKSGQREIRVPFLLNANERSLLSLVEGERTPEPEIGWTTYRKRTGMHDDGALRYEFVSRDDA